MDWITGADLSEVAQYEQAVQQLDIENFTSFVILALWAGNIDWGANWRAGGNWYAARMRAGPDARWRLFVWDAETTFGLRRGQDISFSQAAINHGGPFIPILASLLASPQYQAYFTAQVERHLAGPLATESAHDRLAALAAELRPAMAAEAARWLPDREPAVLVAQWEAALQWIADALAVSEQQLCQLSDPKTLRPLLPNSLLLDDLAPLPSLSPDTRVVLLVGQPAELAPGDAAVVAHLAARGATVNVVWVHEDSPHDPALVAASHDLILLSSSVQSLDQAVRYTQTATPLIFWEPLLLAAGAPLSSRGGPRPEQTDIRIVDAGHSITAGLPVDQQLRVVRRPNTFSVAWPSNGPGVQVLAKHVFGGDYAIMVAEAGAELANGQLAQARTVFMFWHHDTFHWSTGEAIRLFDRAVNWALGLLSPPCETFA